MTYYFVSDLHVDFYSPETRSMGLLLKAFEKFYEQNFLPADACCIAGDIANNYLTYVEFLKFIATKYAKVYLCLGNHDIIMEWKSHYGMDCAFLNSEEKIAFFCDEAAKIQNVHLLENQIADGIAGCMGMCDFKYKHTPKATVTQNKMLWRFRWFDGRYWNYKGNDPDALWRHYSKVMLSLTQQQPNIMMTHFLPLEFGMAERYKHDECSNFFYFAGAKYLENMPDGSIWQAGHTHMAIKKWFTDSKGKKHLLLCNPVGYPNENPYQENGLKKEDFLVDSESLS